MRAIVVYESMFGNTKQVAGAIARGLGHPDDVVVVPVGGVTAELVERADLLVVGGPTHAHGMSRARTRLMAGEMARKPASGLVLEPGAAGFGLRDWFGTLPRMADVPVAAFDTRMHGPSIFTGRASKRIDRLLLRHGARRLVPPESFLVASDSKSLAPGELDRARRWGERLARLAVTSKPKSLVH